MALRVGIREQAALQQLVGRRLDAGHEVRRAERGLLDLREEVVRVAVQHQPADRNQRVVLVAPDLGDVERIVAIGRRVVERHDLDVGLPRGDAAAFDVLEQIARRVVGIVCADLRPLPRR